MYIEYFYFHTPVAKMLAVVIALTMDQVAKRAPPDEDIAASKYIFGFADAMARLEQDAASGNNADKYTNKFITALSKWADRAPSACLRVVMRAAYMSAQMLLVLAPFISVAQDNTLNDILVLNAPRDALNDALDAAIDPSSGKTRVSLRAELIGLLAPLFVHGHLSFPWKRLSSPSMATMMERLRAYKPSLLDTQQTVPWTPEYLQKQGYADGPAAYALFAAAEPPPKKRSKHYKEQQQQYVTFLSSVADYNTISCLMDSYTEEARLSARRADAAQSPLDLWRSNIDCVTNVLRQCGGDWTPEMMRDEFYLIARECTQFKPTLALCVYRMLGARRILDPCAGWGDRLAGAVAHAGTERYLAYDPNTALRAGHSQFIADYANTMQNVEVRYEPFEQARIDEEVFEGVEEPFDLVFTSPPFFDLEVYTSLPGQSIVSFPTLAEWVDGFLDVLIVKSWAVLAIGGHLVLHLADTERTQVVEHVYRTITAFGGDYRGVVHSVTLTGKPRPMWIFRKT